MAHCLSGPQSCDGRIPKALVTAHTSFQIRSSFHRLPTHLQGRFPHCVGTARELAQAGGKTELDPSAKGPRGVVCCWFPVGLQHPAPCPPARSALLTVSPALCLPPRRWRTGRQPGSKRKWGRNNYSPGPLSRRPWSTSGWIPLLRTSAPVHQPPLGENRAH